MNEKEKREKLHQILDLVLDVNGFEQRQVEYTGDKPTVFFDFHGHICGLCLQVCEKGYDSNKTVYDFSEFTYLQKDQWHIDKCEENLDEMIKYLEGLKNGRDFN